MNLDDLSARLRQRSTAGAVLAALTAMTLLGAACSDSGSDRVPSATAPGQPPQALTPGDDTAASGATDTAGAPAPGGRADRLQQQGTQLVVVGQPIVGLDEAKPVPPTGLDEAGLLETSHLPGHRRLGDPGQVSQLGHRAGVRGVDEELTEQMELMLGAEEGQQRRW